MVKFTVECNCVLVANVNDTVITFAIDDVERFNVVTDDYFLKNSAVESSCTAPYGISWARLPRDAWCVSMYSSCGDKMIGQIDARFVCTTSEMQNLMSVLRQLKPQN